MTVIVAKYVNNAKEGKKFGSIVAPDGSKYMLPVGIQDAFVAGQTYDVPTSNKKWGQDAVVVIEGRPGAAGSTNPATPPPTSPPYPPTNTNQPAPPPTRSNGALGKEGEMFVMGVVGRAMGSGKFDVTDIDLLTKAAVQAWRGNVV